MANESGFVAKKEGWSQIVFLVCVRASPWDACRFAVYRIPYIYRIPGKHAEK